MLGTLSNENRKRILLYRLWEFSSARKSGTTQHHIFFTRNSQGSVLCIIFLDIDSSVKDEV